MFVAVCDQKRGNSTSLLLERRAVLARDQRVAQLPLDLVERVAAGDREEAPRSDARLLVEHRVHVLLGGRSRLGGRLLRGRHACPPGRRCGKCFRPVASDVTCERTRHARRRVGRTPTNREKSRKLRKKACRSRPDPTAPRQCSRAAARYARAEGGVVGAVAAARLGPAAQVAGRAGREEQHREPTEHEQRHRHRRRAGRVDVSGGRRPSRYRCRLGRRRSTWPPGSTASSGSVSSRRVSRPSSCSPSPRWLASPGSGSALLRVGERAADLLLRVRVVEDVGRERADRLAVAVERIDLVDAPVVVPVGDHRIRTARVRRGRGSSRGQQRQQQQRAAEQEKGRRPSAVGRSVCHDVDPTGRPPECPAKR